LSRIKREVKEAMRGFHANGRGELSAGFVFGEEFVGFQGHFPMKKVLPGVCQIQCIKAMLEEWKKADVSLLEIVKAKYLLPVAPLEELTVKCSLKDECVGAETTGEGCTLRATVSRGGEKVAEFRLKVSFGGSRKRG
jgi:3-hydroxyacyl-[acyl-carrier-protein] dehydratase